MNILTKHELILSKFNEEIERYKNLLVKLSAYETVDEDVRKFADKIRLELDSKCGKNIYQSLTCKIINEFKTTLKIPLLFGRKNCEILQRKKTLEKLFDDILKRIIKNKSWNDDKLNLIEWKNIDNCPTCNNSDNTLFEIDDIGRKTCLACCAQLQTLETGNTSLDYNRATVTGKFIYNRLLHFQDCIKQFQGKQNCKIPDKIYVDLEKKLLDYRLLIDSDNPLVRYSKITKQHILMFLKELKYVKHYENVNVIYSVLTNKKIDDIGNLEKQLLEDFKELVILYDNLHSKDKAEEIDRKNFLNVQYLLFQFLRRHGYYCKIEDFSILKTTDRKQFHDKICCKLFQKLGWNFTPVF